MTWFSHGAVTITGRFRSANEDCYLAQPPLYAVADGMGGHGAGEVASAIAIEALTVCAQRPPLSAVAVLAALDDANHAIVDRGSRAGTASGDGVGAATGMGTTITGLASLETGGGTHLMVFNIGDSRVYRLADGRLDQVTIDHSEVEELVLAGQLTRGEARTHPRRNIVTRALGTDPPPTPDHWLVPAIAGDRYLLCSDGLSSELTDERITELLATGDPQAAADELVSAANRAGGRDNITAVVVDVAADDEEDVGADTVPRPVLPRQGEPT